MQWPEDPGALSCWGKSWGPQTQAMAPQCPTEGCSAPAQTMEGHEYVEAMEPAGAATGEGGKSGGARAG